jgi:hypothetical protein
MKKIERSFNDIILQLNTVILTKNTYIAVIKFIVKIT